LACLRAAHQKNIKRTAVFGGGVADVLPGVGFVLSFVKPCASQRGGVLKRGAFAEDLPGTGRENALFVYIHPGGDFFENLLFLRIEGAVAAERHTQQEVAVFAHNVHQHPDYRGGAFVGMTVIKAAVIMPVSQAGTGLPGQRLNLIALAAFNIPYHTAALVVGKHLAGNYCFEAAVVLLYAAVVIMGGDFQTHIAYRNQRQCCIIKIDQIGLIAIYQIHCPVVKLCAVSSIGDAGAIVPVPLAVNGAGIAGIGTAGMILGVQILGVQPFPPEAFAVGDGQDAVIGNSGIGAGGISSLGRLIPNPCVRGMDADAEAQAVFPGCLRPAGYQILLGADCGRIPRLIFVFEVVEVVMMIG